MDQVQYSPVYDDQIVKFLQSEFSRFKDECYIDHAGTTLYADSQIKSVADDLLTLQYGNPHSAGLLGNLTAEAIEHIRYLILDHFHTNHDEYSIIFTSGATDSLKTVAETFEFKSDANSNESGKFVYLQDNHTSVLGMRETISNKNIEVHCLEHTEAFQILKSDTEFVESSIHNSNSLFVYSAQCNFSGLKYPLGWIKKVKQGILNHHYNTKTNWYTMLDAASFVATNDLDLSIFKPDFICMSFYKLFGYPSGLGALLVRNESSTILKKGYYGGGTIQVALSLKNFHVKKTELYERFEDGTLPFLSIVSLKYGLKILSKISMYQISTHVFRLAKLLYYSLLSLHHSNGNPVIKIYSDTDYSDQNLQGGTVNFNILRSNGEFVGFIEVLSMANLYKIHLRVGCFCNPGACQRHLNLSNEEVLKNFSSGYTCGGSVDLINNQPTGSVRVSFGYMSVEKDVQLLLKMIKDCFVHGKEIIQLPTWWDSHRKSVIEKFYNVHINGNNGLQNKPVNLNSKIRGNKSQAIYYLNSYNKNGHAKYLDYQNGTEIQLSRLYIYPIKSCGAFEIKNSWPLTLEGLKYDREYMILTHNGVCLTQKQESKMCLIAPYLDMKYEILVLNYPGMPSCSIPLTLVSNYVVSANICKGKVCGYQRKGMDCGPEVSEWLSLALKRPNLKLIKYYRDRNETTSNTSGLSFSSQSQYLLINEASILWLADKITNFEECKKQSLLGRFRGNIIIKGCNAFEETNWKYLKIGKMMFEVTGLCNRCQMVCIDQETGTKTVEPLRTMAEELHGKIKFGIYLKKLSKDNISINIGDTIRIIE